MIEKKDNGWISPMYHGESFVKVFLTKSD